MWRNIMEEPPFVNIMLLGLTGSGKSASGNTIIGVRETFKEDLSPEAVTRFCKSEQTELDGQTITVIDTVGLSDTSVKITDAQTQIEQILQSTCDGVDVFLLVIKLGETLTEESRKVVKWIKNNFGSKLLKHTIVLFTHGDLLHKPIEKYLGECETLRSVVDQCSGRYHVFNNKDEDRSQVTELMKKTKSLRMMNAYKRYTEQDYKQTQNDILLKKFAAGAEAVGAGVGGAVTAAGGGGAMASMMGTAFTVGKAAVIGAAGGPVLAAGGGVGAMASMMGTAFTVGKAAIIGAAGGPAVAAGGGVGAMASMMGTAFTVGKAAVIGAAGGPAVAAGGGVGAMASMMGTAFTVGKAAVIGAAGGPAVAAGGGVGAMASMMGTAFTVGKAAVIGAAGGPVLAAGGGVGAMASMMGTAFTVGKAAIIGAAGGPAVAAAAAVGSVIFLAKKYR